MHLEVGSLEHAEETEPLDVVHMEMREQDVDPHDLGIEREAQAADPVPASKMTTVPSASRASTHTVLPP